MGSGARYFFNCEFPSLWSARRTLTQASGLQRPPGPRACSGSAWAPRVRPAPRRRVGRRLALPPSPDAQTTARKPLRFSRPQCPRREDGARTPPACPVRRGAGGGPHASAPGPRGSLRAAAATGGDRRARPAARTCAAGLTSPQLLRVGGWVWHVCGAHAGSHARRLGSWPAAAWRGWPTRGAFGCPSRPGGAGRSPRGSVRRPLTVVSASSADPNLHDLGKTNPECFLPGNASARCP